MSRAPLAEDAATRVFTALSDGTRRAVLDLVARREVATATALAEGLTISRQAVLKHLSVLADAGLVESSRVGREVRFRVRPEPLRRTASWLASRADSWDDQLFALKAEAEKRAADPAPWQAAGATWVLTDLDPETLRLDAVRGMVRDGPSRPT